MEWENIYQESLEFEESWRESMPQDYREELVCHGKK